MLSNVLNKGQRFDGERRVESKRDRWKKINLDGANHSKLYSQLLVIMMRRKLGPWI